MLFKNNVKYSLTEDDKAKLMKVIGKFPVRLQLGPGAYTPNPNTENPTRVDRPELIIVPYTELVNDETEGEAVTWNYTDLPPITDRSNGMLNFYTNCDGGLKFSGSFSMSKGQEDLAFFLIFISKMSTHNPESKRKLIEVDNRAAKAMEIVNSKKKRVTVEGLIMGDNMLDIAEITRIAKAMGVTGLDHLTDEEVRVNLYSVVEAREATEKDGYQTFLVLSENEYRKETLEAVTKSIDYNLAVFNTGIKKWILCDSEGNKTDELCSMVVGKKPFEALQIHAIKNEKIAAKLKEAVAAYEKELAPKG